MSTSSAQLVFQGVFTGLLVIAAAVGFVSLANMNGLAVDLVIPEPTPLPAAPVAADPGAPDGSADAPAVVTVDPTPAPLPTWTPLPAPAARSYYNEVASDLSLVVVSLKRMQALLSAPKAVDPAWRREVGEVMTLISGGHERLAQVDPPDESADTHVALLKAVEQCQGVLEPITGDLTTIPDDGYALVANLLRLCTDDAVAVLHQLAE